MLKIKFLIIILMAIYILDKLYLLPFYPPLDTKPDSRRSATYLAKSIAKEAKCDDIWLLDINYKEGDDVLNFDCIFDTYLLFNIYVFLNDEVREQMINNQHINNSTGYSTPCFKKGAAYMICEAYVVKNKKDRPIFSGKRYYNQFPGEEISFDKNLQFKLDSTTPDNHQMNLKRKI